MKEIYVDIKEIASGLEKRDLLKIIAACYIEDEYGCDVCDMDCELENIDEFIDDDGNFLADIENTLANVDREYGDEEDWEEDEEDFPSEDEDYEDDYEDEDYEEDYECDCGTCEECTQRKIEENRRRNEEYLGL